MLRQSVAGYPIAEARFNDCVFCHYYYKKDLVKIIGKSWRYCEAYINQYLGENETENMKNEKKTWYPLTNSYQQIKPLKKNCVIK